MKVIELLNKIANGEETPKKIKYDNTIFNLVINDFGSIYYKNEYGEDLFDSYNIYKTLNDEVEIIEDKKIEYIEGRFKNFKHYIKDTCFRVQPLEDLELNQNEIVIIDKINEIINKINEMENK